MTDILALMTNEHFKNMEKKGRMEKEEDNCNNRLKVEIIHVK